LILAHQKARSLQLDELTEWVFKKSMLCVNVFIFQLF
jgi:hypothetical protein